MSSLNDLVNLRSTQDSGSKTVWNKFAPGHTSQVILVSDLEGNPRNLPELQLVKKYSVHYDYLVSEKEKQYNPYGRDIYYVDGDPLHPGHIARWKKEKQTDDEDIIRNYIRSYGVVAYIFNISAYRAIQKVHKTGFKGTTEAEKFYAGEFGNSSGSGNTAEGEVFNGIMTYELHKGFADMVEAFYMAVVESGSTDWVSNYVWDVTRPRDGSKYSISKNIAIRKIDDEDVAANPNLDVELIEEAFAKAASEELALPSLWDTVINRKRYTPPQELPSEYSFKDQPGAATAETSDEPVHVTTGRGAPVAEGSADGISDEDFADDEW